MIDELIKTATVKQVGETYEVTVKGAIREITVVKADSKEEAIAKTQMLLKMKEKEYNDGDDIEINPTKLGRK